MSLDVVYQGLPVAKDARIHFEGNGIFVEVEGPMPVATQLLLSHSDKTLTGRVCRVREGAGAGMLIMPTEAGKLPRWLIALHPETAHNAQFEPEPEPIAVVAPAAVEPAPTACTPEVAPAAVEPAPTACTQEVAPAASSAEATPPANTASSEPVEAAPSNRTPESEADGASGEEDEGKQPSAKPGTGDKKAAAGASKPKKKNRRR